MPKVISERLAVVQDLQRDLDRPVAGMSSEIKELIEKRNDILGRTEHILQMASSQNRDLTTEEMKDFDRWISEARRFRDKIDAAAVALEEERNDVAREAEIAEILGVFDGRGDGEVRAILPEQRLASFTPHDRERLSLGRMVRGMLIGNWEGAEAERRAMGENTGSLGGFLIPTSVSSGVIDMARNKSVVIGAGALTIPMQTPEMTIVKVVTDPQGSWRKEHQAIDESDAVFEPIKVKTMALAALCRVSLEMIEDAPLFSQTIENAISASLALELDRAALMGTGVNEPRGIFFSDGVGEQTMGTNGAAFTDYDPFLDAIEDIETANGTAGAAIYSPRTNRALSGLKTGISGDKTPLQPPQSFLDLRRFVTNQIPNDLEHGTATNASTSMVGDFSQMAFALRTTLIIEATRYGGDTFSKMEALVRGYLRADVAVFRPNHFSKITGIIPA